MQWYYCDELLSDVRVAQLSEHKRPYDVSRSAEHKGVGDVKLPLTDPVFLCYNRPGVPCVVVVPAVLATWPLTQQTESFIRKYGRNSTTAKPPSYSMFCARETNQSLNTRI